MPLSINASGTHEIRQIAEAIFGEVDFATSGSFASRVDHGGTCKTFLATKGTKSAKSSRNDR
jgi:hypothetical protein